MKIVNYIVVQAQSAHTLSASVSRLLNEGYLPQGGVNVFEYEDTNSMTDKFYTQAMVKPKESYSSYLIRLFKSAYMGLR